MVRIEFVATLCNNALPTPTPLVRNRWTFLNTGTEGIFTHVKTGVSTRPSVARSLVSRGPPGNSVVAYLYHTIEVWGIGGNNMGLIKSTKALRAIPILYSSATLAVQGLGFYC